MCFTALLEHATALLRRGLPDHQKKHSSDGQTYLVKLRR
jgi:hypothetical protein